MALQITQSPESKAFANFVRILQRDARLASVVKKDRWNVRTGAKCELKDFGVAECPYIKLTPRPGPASWGVMGGAFAEHKFDLVIDIETGVEGSNAHDSMNLWSLILQAMFPATATDESAEAKDLRDDAAITRIEIEQAAWGGEPEGDVRLIVGRGSVRLSIYIRTPVR